MQSNHVPLKFAVNVLGLVEGRMTHQGQWYRFITNILSTPQEFRKYFNEYGTPTPQGKKAINEATRQGRAFDCQVYHAYCFMLRIKAEAQKMIERKEATHA